MTVRQCRGSDTILLPWRQGDGHTVNVNVRDRKSAELNVNTELLYDPMPTLNSLLYGPSLRDAQRHDSCQHVLLRTRAAGRTDAFWLCTVTLPTLPMMPNSG